MIRELVAQGNTFLNAFGSKDSANLGMSPRNLVHNLPHVDYNDLKYEFGQYVQLHITKDPTNTMKSCTIRAIVLGPRMIQGCYNFMSLETGAQIDGRVVALPSITNNVIHRVEALGQSQKQPFQISKMLQYEWRSSVTIDENDTIIAEDAPAAPQGILPCPIAQLGLPDLVDPLGFLQPNLVRGNPPQGVMIAGGNNVHLNDDILVPPQQLDAADSHPSNDLDATIFAQDASNDNFVLDNSFTREENQREPLFEPTFEPEGNQGADNQGVETQEVENQGAESQGASLETSDARDNSSEDSDISYNESSNGSSFKEIQEGRDVKQQRRGDYFKQPSKSEYGRGKRD